MLFNSLDFFIFLSTVFVLYWASKKQKIQNVILLIGSYIFYGWWDWRFLSLIAISSICDYIIGLRLDTTDSILQKKSWLLLSVVINLGILGFFKYFNFFTHTFCAAFLRLGIRLNEPTLNIILPVGISFYTFQTLSYTLDIYKKHMKPTTDIIAFLAFVSFFPQLVAGPIERAKNLLPQFQTRRHFKYTMAIDGTRQMLWGLFKKMVVADNCAVYVNYVFENYDELPGRILFLGAIYFAFQIYGDFSGYSDIAIGTAKLFGFKLTRNFAYPYFSYDISEFWRRWHISLSTWMRDYIYIPLGGNRGNKSRQIINVLITFTISGLWHGANLTFLLWGMLNGIYMIPTILSGNTKTKKVQDIVSESILFPSIQEFMKICRTFLLIDIAWIFFRAETWRDAFSFLAKTCSLHSFFAPLSDDIVLPSAGAIVWIGILLVVEWVQREKVHPLRIKRFPIFARWGIYLVLSLVIFNFTVKKQIPFIYFQF